MIERWLNFRNRLLASAAFQSWAGRFRPTRPIARRRAARLFDLTAGFVYSQTLLAWIESGLIDGLADGAADEAALTHATGVDVARLRPFLVAGEALGLGQRLRDGRWMLGPEGAALRGNSGLIEMIRHHHLLYADLADPKLLLAEGGGRGALANYWPYATSGDGDASPYSRLMAASQPMIAEQVLGAYDFGRHRKLLDIGGGQGAFLDAVGARYPALSFQLFDLPEVVPSARKRLGDRAEVFAGDFREDAIPHGADLVSLVRILHDHNDDVVRALLAKLHQEMMPGATLLIAEPMADTPHAGGMTAYFSLYLLAMGSGRPRSRGEISRLLEAAGFVRVRRRPTAIPMICSILTAERSIM